MTRCLAESGSQFFLQDLPGKLRVCLALGEFHHLPFEKVQRGKLASFEIRCGTGIRADHLIGESLDSPRVTDLLESPFFDDLCRSAGRSQTFLRRPPSPVWS